LKQGDVLSPLLFNFVSRVEYAIRRAEVNQDGLKLNGIHQLLVYADDVNISGGSVHIIRENAEALVVASKETRLEVNADKNKYIVTFRDQNVKRNRSIKIDNRYFESLEEFKYLGTNLTNQNSIQEEITSKVKSGNVCYNSVQNLLSSSSLYKNLKMKIYRNIILPVVACGWET